MNLFEDINNNIRMLKGAYRKFKGYYYYSNYLLMKDKIANFENDEKEMEATFSKLAKAIKNPTKEESVNYLDEILHSVDFYVLPKKYDNTFDKENNLITNETIINKKLKSVNFFIDGSVELFILDTLWTIFLSKIINDNNVISKDVYGNTIKTHALFQDDEINFESIDLFHFYLPKYSNWRNNAFDKLNDNYNKGKDSILISLDIKSYFYSIRFDINDLSQLLYPHEMLDEIGMLSSFFGSVFSSYESKVRHYIYLEKTTKGNILPIGLFSSMVLGNVYLSNIDIRISNCKNLSYYGRYVDDMLFVFEYNKTDQINRVFSNDQIIEKTLVNEGILNNYKEGYFISGKDELCIQNNKIKTIYINHRESRAIIDIYNDTIRIVPSQVEFIPNEIVKLSDFEEMVVSFDKFTIDNKLREIGTVNIESNKVKKFFSDLLNTYSGVEVMDRTIRKEQLKPIFMFFSGSQAIEYYLCWKDFFAFLVVCNQNMDILFWEFAKKINRIINEDWIRLNKNDYHNIDEITYILRKTLQKYITISMLMALALDADFSNEKLVHFQKNAKKYRKANIFNNRYVTFPLANYLNYDKEVSYVNMDLDEIGDYKDNILNMFKFRWSPRFIHFHELLMLPFYDFQKKHKQWQDMNNIMDIYLKINSIRKSTFDLSVREENYFNNDYILQNIDINTTPNDENMDKKSTIITAVASICMDEDDNHNILNLKNEKRKLNRLLKTVSKYKKELEKGKTEKIKCAIIVFPECYLPVNWIKDLIYFSYKSQIGVVTGLRHFKDNNGLYHNFLLTILPFLSAGINYKNVFINLREKNDYAPIEFDNLRPKVRNLNPAIYRVFKWQGIKMTSIVCFEITDVVVRAILKGRCGLIALAVFNPDTSYFSNIVESLSRDLHAFVIQSNLPLYGDSRVTAPYNSNNKDVLKIKGGENEFTVIGTVDYDELMEYEKCYYENLQRGVCISSKCKEEMFIDGKKMDKFPENWEKIKPLPARFKRDDW